MTTKEKLQEIIEKGGFEARVATAILKSPNLFCSEEQWEVIRCSHDDLDWTELNTVDIHNLRHARFENFNDAEIARQKKSVFNN